MPDDANIICVAGGTGLAAVSGGTRLWVPRQTADLCWRASTDRLYFTEECKDIAGAYRHR